MLDSLDRLERFQRRLDRYLPEPPSQEQAQAQASRTETRNAAQLFLDSIPAGESLTEWLLTSPEAFGITTATPAQRAICRILDGVPLGDIAQHPDVIALCGREHGREAIVALPSERGQQPRELVLLAAIRAAKTIIACAAAIRMALTVDVTGISPSETVRVSIVSLALDLASKAFKNLAGTITRSPRLSALLLGEPTAGRLYLAHPSGRAIEVSIVAGKKAGGSLISDWSAGVIFDEAPRMNGASDAVVNLDDARNAVQGRLLPGAQALYIGSPHAPFGPVYDMVEGGFGQPTATRVVLRGTGPMLNPSRWTPEFCDQLRAENPSSYHTDALGEFAQTDGGLLNPDALRRNTRGVKGGLYEGAPLGDLPYELRGEYAAALDPSEGTEHGNPWTLVIVKREQRLAPAHRPDGSPLLDAHGERETRPRKRYVVALVREWRGMRPEQILEEVAALCRGYGLSSAATDQYAGAANADLARQHGLRLDVLHWTGTRKVQVYTDLATLVESDDVELHADPQFQRDLASVRKKTTQQGFAILLPQTGDGRHCDYAPSLASAIERASKTTSDMSVGGARGRGRW